jgi:predicted lipoprotein
MKKLSVFLSLAFIFFAGSCGEDSNPSSETPTNAYDKTPILNNWANNIIIPSYENYVSKLSLFSIATADFTLESSQTRLDYLRTKWLDAYKAFQYVAIFDLGKAEEFKLKDFANTFPTNTSGINSSIPNDAYNLNAISNISNQGFPAIDYLINGLAENDAAILARYNDDNSSNLKRYLVALANQIEQIANLVLKHWKAEFKSSFVSDNSNTVVSSFNVLTNDFIKNLEKDIRTSKIGIPSGALSDGIKFPEQTEGFYKKDVSRILALEALKASQDFFNGKHFNSETTGPSLKSYLDEINVVRDGKKLSDIINNQYELSRTAINNLDDNFTNQVNTDNAKMITAFDALQQNVVYLKLDMLQALNVTTDYVDGDGD